MTKKNKNEDKKIHLYNCQFKPKIKSLLKL